LSLSFEESISFHYSDDRYPKKLKVEYNLETMKKMEVVWSCVELLVVVLIAFFVYSNISDHNSLNYGKPLNVMTVKGDGGLKIEDSFLDKLFLDPAVKDRKPVIISILGDFRKGKSFLLDYFLRFLYANVSFVMNA
jgi:Guanylate-binding protein, N-terminal domain